MGGCCAGAQKAGPSRTSGTDDGSLLEKGQLPVARNWTSKTPITISELKLKRETFWDTQPHYGGRREIWDALKSVLPLPAEDGLAIAVLQAAEIKFPSGTWHEIYDSTGFRYDIPEYALNNPTNIQLD